MKTFIGVAFGIVAAVNFLAAGYSGISGSPDDMRIVIGLLDLILCKLYLD